MLASRFPCSLFQAPRQFPATPSDKRTQKNKQWAANKKRAVQRGLRVHWDENSQQFAKNPLIVRSLTHSREPPRPAAALLRELPRDLFELRLEGLQRGAVDEKVAREVDHEEERGDAVAAHGPEGRRERHVSLQAVESIAAKST